MNVGQRIREAREDLGMQGTVLARRVGVAKNHLYLIEHGDRMPSLGLLEKIARVLRVEPAELLREPVLTSPKDKAPDKGPDTGPPHHQRMVSDSVEVSDAVKHRIEQQFDILIDELEAIRHMDEAAELTRVRDKVLAAV